MSDRSQKPKQSHYQRLDASLFVKNELAILKKQSEGYDLMTSAKQVGIPYDTAGHINKRIKQKCGISTIEQLTVAAVKAGLVDPFPFDEISPKYNTLSDQQKKVVQLTAQGMSLQQIASELSITYGAAKSSRNCIWHTLGLENRTSMAIARAWASVTARDFYVPDNSVTCAIKQEVANPANHASPAPCESQTATNYKWVDSMVNRLQQERARPGLNRPAAAPSK